MNPSERRALHRMIFARIETGPPRAAPAIWPYPNHRSLAENDNPHIKHDRYLRDFAMGKASLLWNG